jgi:hypothetical protein
VELIPTLLMAKGQFAFAETDNEIKNIILAALKKK